MKGLLKAGLLLAGACTLIDIGGYVGQGMALANLEAIERISTSKLRKSYSDKAKNGTLKNKWACWWINEGYNSSQHAYTKREGK